MSSSECGQSMTLLPGRCFGSGFVSPLMLDSVTENVCLFSKKETGNSHAGFYQDDSDVKLVKSCGWITLSSRASAQDGDKTPVGWSASCKSRVLLDDFSPDLTGSIRKHSFISDPSLFSLHPPNVQFTRLKQNLSFERNSVKHNLVSDYVRLIKFLPEASQETRRWVRTPTEVWEVKEEFSVNWQTLRRRTYNLFFWI